MPVLNCRWCQCPIDQVGNPTGCFCIHHKAAPLKGKKARTKRIDPTQGLREELETALLEIARLNSPSEVQEGANRLTEAWGRNVR